MFGLGIGRKKKEQPRREDASGGGGGATQPAPAFETEPARYDGNGPSLTPRQSKTKNLLKLLSGIFKGQKSRPALEQPGRKRKKRMEFDLPTLEIRVLSDPPPEGRVRARYKVGLSTVTIVEDRYIITDPFLSEEEKEELERTASQLLFLMPTAAVRDESAFKKHLEGYGIRDEVLYYFLKREILGYGVFDVLMQDDRIEDITAWPETTSCTHKDFGTLRTNISMSEQEFNRYVEKFVHMAGKSVSLYSPLLSIRLPTNDRLTVTYAREVSSKPSFSIRKFPKQPWSITSIMMMGTLTPEMAAWLMLVIKYKRAVLVCGPIGTGKTSLINALCSLIPASAIIVTIEDTPELRLTHPNWFSFITRESATVEEKGEIGMFELVKHALRQPADYIIVGEVRGEEGRIWAQAIATGHGGITSLHAETPEGAIERLRADPIKVTEGALRELSTVVIMKSLFMKRAGGTVKVRRIMGIYDLVPKAKTGAGTAAEAGTSVEPVCLFRYDPESDSFALALDPLSSFMAERLAETSPRERLAEEYRLYVRFLRSLLALGPVFPELGSHVKVTELVQELYAKGELPEELRRLEAEAGLREKAEAGVQEEATGEEREAEKIKVKTARVSVSGG